MSLLKKILIKSNQIQSNIEWSIVMHLNVFSNQIGFIKNKNELTKNNGSLLYFEQ